MTIAQQNETNTEVSKELWIEPELVEHETLIESTKGIGGASTAGSVVLLS